MTSGGSRRFHDAGHDPAVLADPAIPREAEPLVGRQYAVEEKAGRHRAGVLRVSLHGPAAQARDQVDRTGQSCVRHAPAPVSLADEVARDPPIRWGRLTLLIRGAVLDPRHLARSSELAPADAAFAVEDECRVGLSR